MTGVLEAWPCQKETQDLSHCGLVRNAVTLIEGQRVSLNIVFVLLHCIQIVLKLDDLRGIRSYLEKFIHSLNKQRDLGETKWNNFCSCGI